MRTPHLSVAAATGLFAVALAAAPSLTPVTATAAVTASPAATPTPTVTPQPMPPPDLDGDVARTLVGYAGTAVSQVDDSSTTKCQAGSAPQTVAYRTDGVMLRRSGTAAAITAAVKGALAAPAAASSAARGAAQVHALADPPPLGGIHVGTPEIIKLPGDVVPAVHVPLSVEGEGRVPVVAVARRLRAHGIPASPNYLFSPSGPNHGVWPYGDPLPTTQATPVRVPSTTGAGVDVVVYDVGVPDPTQGTVVPQLTRLKPADVEKPDSRAPKGLADRYYAGHTLAIAGTIAAVAPGASIVAARVTGPDGVVSDLTALRRMAKTLKDANAAGTWPELVVAAFGTSSCDVNGTAPKPGPLGQLVPLGEQAVAEAIQKHGESLYVVAAGNRSTAREFYPAAFTAEGVVAVGALDARGSDGDAWTDPSRSGKPADFSNFGSWVTSWAPGVSLAVSHLNGLAFSAGGPVLGGQARIDGTSYAAPYVAGLVAGHLSLNPTLSPGQAWAAITAKGTRCSTVGGGIAVTLTSMAAAADAPARTTPSGC